MIGTEWALYEAFGLKQTAELCDLWERVGLPAAAWVAAINTDKMSSLASWKVVCSFF